jgi:hypothetical protein
MATHNPKGRLVMEDHDLNQLARDLRSQMSPQFDHLTIVPEEDGLPIFAIYPARFLTQDEVTSACEKMAKTIRRMIPERSNGWATSIIVEPSFGTGRGVYFIGWAGRGDQWVPL